MNKLVFNEQTFEFKKWYFTESSLSEPTHQIHCFVDGILFDKLKVEGYDSERWIFNNESFKTVSSWDGEFGFNNCVDYVNYFNHLHKK
jgi:hypothetical protein